MNAQRKNSVPNREVPAEPEPECPVEPVAEKFDPEGSAVRKLTRILEPTKKDPIWQRTFAETFKLSVVAAWISFILYLSASNFDHTELRAIAGILVGLGGLRGISKLVQQVHDRD